VPAWAHKYKAFTHTHTVWAPKSCWVLISNYYILSLYKRIKRKIEGILLYFLKIFALLVRRVVDISGRSNLTTAFSCLPNHVMNFYLPFATSISNSVCYSMCVIVVVVFVVIDVVDEQLTWFYFFPTFFLRTFKNNLNGIMGEKRVDGKKLCGMKRENGLVVDGISFHLLFGSHIFFCAIFHSNFLSTSFTIHYVCVHSNFKSQNYIMKLSSYVRERCLRAKWL
jgi:hypothetical protein